MKKNLFSVVAVFAMSLNAHMWAQTCNPGYSNITVSSTTACANSIITVNATGGSLPSGAYYNWRGTYSSACSQSVLGGGIDFGQQGNLPAIQGAQFQMPATGQATYYIRLTAVCSNGVRSCASSDIAVSRIGAPVIVSSNNTVLFCANTPATMSVSVTSGSSYSWTKNGSTVAGATTPTLNIASPTATDAGLYRCLATNACGTTTSSAITFTTLGNQNVAGAAVAIQNSTKTYSVVASPGVSYSWTISSGGTITSATNTNSVSVDWGSATGIYTLTLSKTLSTCQVTDTKTVSVEACATNTTSIFIGGLSSNTICATKSYYLETGIAGIPSSYTWTASDGASIPVGTQYPSFPSANANTTYTVNYTDNNTCPITGTFNLVVLPLPQFSVAVAPGTTICTNETATLSVVNSTNATFYDWGPSGGANMNLDMEIIPNGTSGTYTMVANGYNGDYQCKTSHTITVNANFCTGIDELTSNSSVKIYPNPANSELNITLEKSSQITIVNILGGVVYSQKAEAGKNTINISDFTKGVYFIQTKAGARAKFIKE